MSELISGKEALVALANGEGVEFKNPFQNIWVDIRSLTINEINGGYYRCSDDNEKIDTVFRIKPKTITLNGIEVQASSNVYNGGLIWILCGTDTREYTSLALDENDELPAYFWDSEDKIKQVVAALRSIFKGE